MNDTILTAAKILESDFVTQGNPMEYDYFMDPGDETVVAAIHPEDEDAWIVYTTDRDAEGGPQEALSQLIGEIRKQASKKGGGPFKPVE